MHGFTSNTRFAHKIFFAGVVLPELGFLQKFSEGEVPGGKRTQDCRTAVRCAIH